MKRPVVWIRYFLPLFSIIFSIGIGIVLYRHLIVGALDSVLLIVTIVVVAILSGVISYLVPFKIMFRETVVPPMSALVVERDGEYFDSKSTGGVVYLRRKYLFGLLGSDERPHQFSTREQVVNFEVKQCYTKDGVTVGITASMNWYVKDPLAYKRGPENINDNLVNSAGSEIRQQIGRLTLSDLLFAVDQINQKLMTSSFVSPTWGIVPKQLQIIELRLPPELEAAINRSLAAERDRKTFEQEAESTAQSWRRVQDILGDKELVFEYIKLAKEGRHKP